MLGSLSTLGADEAWRRARVKLGKVDEGIDPRGEEDERRRSRGPHIQGHGREVSGARQGACCEMGDRGRGVQAEANDDERATPRSSGISSDTGARCMAFR